MHKIFIADFKRLLKSKVLIISVASLILSYVIMLIFYFFAAKFTPESIADTSFGRLLVTMGNVNMGVSAMPGFLGFFGIFIVYGLIASELVSKHFATRTIESYLVSGLSRRKIFFSKMFVAWLFAVMIAAISLFILFFLSGILSGFGMPITNGILGEFILRVCFDFVIYIAMMSLAVFLAFMLKSPRRLYGAIIGIVMGVLFFSEIARAFSNVSEGGTFFTIIIYIVDFFTKMFCGTHILSVSNINASFGEVIYASVIVIITFMASILGGLFLFEKRDIKN